MTAYVKNANGAWNSPTLWTPNGVPIGTDTVTFGAFTTSIPNGYTAQCGGITSMAGTDTSTRSYKTPQSWAETAVMGRR